MDLALTKNGDILLEQVFTQSHATSFNFFIKPNSHAVCFKFDIAPRIVDQKHNGICFEFDVRNHQELFNATVLDEKGTLEQMCYNAIRTQRNSLKHALDYGSDFYLEKNKKITPQLLVRAEYIAKEAIKYFAPEALVTASAKATANGMCNVIFDIQIMAHTLNLSYLI